VVVLDRADVDPGTRCFFGEATSPVTTIRCTDDGTITVRLSAADNNGKKKARNWTWWRK
jgi:hypothetical protein